MKFQIPNIVTCGVLIAWQNEYRVDIHLSFSGCYVVTNDPGLKKEIVDIGGALAK